MSVIIIELEMFPPWTDWFKGKVTGQPHDLQKSMVSGFDVLNQSIDLSDIQPLKQWLDDVLPGVLFDTVKDQLNEQVLDLHVTAGAFAAVKVDGQVITWGGPRQRGGRKTHGKAAEHVFFPRKDRDLSRLIWDGIWLGYSGRRLGIIWDMYKFWVNRLWFFNLPNTKSTVWKGSLFGDTFYFLGLSSQNI